MNNFPQITYDGCSNKGNIQEMSWEEWAKEHFEFEYCDECGGDWYDHVPRGMMGNYFALCKIALDPFYQVRSIEKEAKEVYDNYEKFQGYRCKNCYEFCSEYFSELKEHIEKCKEIKK